MSAAYETAPIRGLKLKTFRIRLIRTKSVQRLYDHVEDVVTHERSRRIGVGHRTRLLQEVGEFEIATLSGRPFPLGSWVKRAAAFPGWWERTNAMRVTLPQIGVKHAVHWD